MQKILVLGVSLFFGVLTGMTLWQHGYTEVIRYQMQTLTGQQVFVDLSIALALLMVWIFQDAKKRNRSPWIWIVLTLLFGSVGPLGYLITRPSQFKK